MLRRHGMDPAPRRVATTWRAFLRQPAAGSWPISSPDTESGAKGGTNGDERLDAGLEEFIGPRHTQPVGKSWPRSTSRCQELSRGAPRLAGPAVPRLRATKSRNWTICWPICWPTSLRAEGRTASGDAANLGMLCGMGWNSAACGAALEGATAWRPTSAYRVGAENSSTLCDLGIFVDEPAQSIDSHDPHVRCRSSR